MSDSLRGLKKILVVDDAPEERLALRQALARPGVTVLEAESGRVALDIHRREKVDLIFLDFAMPGLDGEELARRIRADAALRDVFIVMMSDDTRDGIRARALAAGANDVLPKRFNVMELHTRVQKLVQAATRKATQLLAQIEPPSGSASLGPFIGRIVNLSTTGLLLETDADVDLGRDLVVTFSVPGSRTTVRAQARVMRRVPGPGPPKWGLRFTSTDQVGRLALGEYVDRSAQGDR